MNSRRQFLKKSIFGAILGLFAPKLLLTKEDKWADCPPGNIYYPDSWLKQLYYVKGKSLGGNPDWYIYFQYRGLPKLKRRDIFTLQDYGFGSSFTNDFVVIEHYPIYENI